MNVGFILFPTILLYLSAALYGDDPKYHSRSSAFGEPPKEVREIADRARTNSEALRELQELPLEATFETLRSLLQRGYPERGDEIGKVAAQVLSTHPQLESFLSKHIGHMAKLLEPAEPPNPLDNEADAQRSVAFHQIKKLISSARFLPGDGAFRVVGPRLFDRTWREDHEDSTINSHSYAASAVLIWLIKNRLPNEPAPKNLEESRTWWNANGKRFAKKAD